MEEWRARRIAINHDWLGNQYLQALGRWIHAAEGMIDDEEFLRRFPDEGLHAWTDKVSDIRTLLSEARQTLSPTNVAYLFRLPTATTEWLLPVLSLLWERRSKVGERIESAVRCVEEASLHFDLMSSFFTGRAATGPTSAEAVSAMKDFKNTCADLSRALSNLPRST